MGNNNIKKLNGIIRRTGAIVGIIVALLGIVKFLPNPQINEFGADPIKIGCGEVSTLSWSVSDATKVTIDKVPGEKPLSGKTEVYPTETTNYTLTAINWFKKRTAQEVIRVTPNIIHFEAFPSDIIIGKESTLSWSVDGATRITINHGVGEQEESIGETSVSPDGTTTYTLTATNTAGLTSTRVEVKVIQKPVIHSFTASPREIQFLQESTLSWNVGGATKVTISHGVMTRDKLSGEYPVSPECNTTYTLNATNRAGLTTAYATVERGQTKITIGVTISGIPALMTTESIVEKILEPDISEYVDPMGYDVTFDFLFADNQGSAVIALENIQSFKARGMNLVICHGWSPQYQAVIPFANENDMLLFSSSSTSPVLAIPDDSLFRASPTDFEQVPAIAQMWKTWGVDAVLTIYRADAWGDGLWNILETEWQDVDIENLGRFRFPGEETEFSSYLASMDIIITNAMATYGADKVGIQFFSSSELMTIQTQAIDYPGLMNAIWMTTGSGGRSQAMLDEAGYGATQTRHFSPMMAADDDSDEFKKFSETHYDLTGYGASVYSATLYDTCRLLVECILKTGSTEASDIAEVLIPLSQEYYGLTGWMSLDENGDRQPQMYDIWGFYEESGTGDYLSMKFGKYDGQKGEVIWDDDALVGLAGIERPGH